MFAALYGKLIPHAWRASGSTDDAHSLFYHRSLAMGWLDESSTVATGGDEDHLAVAPGLWAMNDAGWDHPRGVAEAGLVSWFQVEASAVAADRPLPVQPFLRCAGDATVRAGTLRLSAVQVLLPVQGLGTASRPQYAPVPSMLSGGWFASCDPEAKTHVEVSISSGQDPSISAVAQQFSDHLDRLEQDVFVCRSFDIAGGGDCPPPPFDDSFWNGPPRHGVVLRGDLTEWSCDAIGWLAETIADLAARLDVRSPLLLAATRR
ncbi:hypothetical protein [Planomonospora parontospora]|uniref:hypothetical protein n=1 Tax=Planomonospora parontospora TaxID=58119 RepID=UPI001E2A7CFB|nr:hypothetical protein [Planomonospora parontospora]